MWWMNVSLIYYLMQLIENIIKIDQASCSSGYTHGFRNSIPRHVDPSPPDEHTSWHFSRVSIVHQSNADMVDK